MAKIKTILLLLLLKAFVAGGQSGYKVNYHFTDSASLPAVSPLLKTGFDNAADAARFVYGLPALLHSKGFAAAALDSVQLDSLSGRVQVFAGEQYKWLQLNTSPTDADLLANAGIYPATFQNRPFRFEEFQDLQQRIINYLENNGQPFAQVALQNMQWNGQSVSAHMYINTGPIYKIDSIRLYGAAKVSNSLLQQHLGIAAGSLYNKKRLAEVSKRLAQLNYLQEEKPSDLTMTATGSILNVYLAPRRNSQFNALIGFLPNPDPTAAKRFQVTGDANILLRNALGNGETIGLNWQQLQLRSPRLILQFEQPYLFQTPFGAQFYFEMFRKDSSFLNISMRLGTTYQISNQQSAVLFYQRWATQVSGFDQQQVIRTRRLPADGDVQANNIGLSYFINSTDYRQNPRRGFDISITGTGGIKKVKKNNSILELKDPVNPSFSFSKLYDTVQLKTYQLRLAVSAARYLPVRKLGVLKLAVHGGAFQSGNVFRNELFQIGGFRLLRGFDEESQYLQYYSVGTVEYRYLIGQNAFFFAFTDGGWGREAEIDYKYISAGLGLSLEIKAGIINLAWALGRRNDSEFNLRASKVHLGFVNYF